MVNPLLEEHILGRALTRLIEFEVKQRLAGKSTDNSSLIDALYRYCSLLEEHIDKENTCFGNTVETYLSEEVQKKVVGAFQKMDEGPCRPLIEKSLALLKKLQDR